MENNTLGNIYCLKNPTTNEIFYVGATIKTLEERLKKHYWDLSSFKNGKREKNKRFEYLIQLEPKIAIIELIEQVPISLLEEKEKEYILKYKEIYPNLTNIAAGGKGGDIYSNHIQERKEEISLKISNALKGKAKPKGFSDNLSESRKGKANPNAKEVLNWIVADNKYLFKYGFEINTFIGSKYAAGNVTRRLGVPNSNPYNRTWVLFSSLDKELQDIVHNLYENRDY